MTAPLVITSRRNEQVVAAARLHQSAERRTSQLTLIEGSRLIDEAISAGAHLASIFGLAGTIPLMIDDQVSAYEVTEPVLERISGTKSPSGPIAVMSVPPDGALEKVPTVVLCGIADPGNAGTLIRTAGAFGYQVAVIAGTVDVWSPKVLRAAAGGHFHTHITRVQDSPIDALHATGLTSVALVTEGGLPVGTPFDGIAALLVGSEADGLPQELVSAAVHRMTIPMVGATESLNAAVAGAIAMERLR